MDFKKYFVFISCIAISACAEFNKDFQQDNFNSNTCNGADCQNQNINNNININTEQNNIDSSADIASVEPNNVDVVETTLIETDLEEKAKRIKDEELEKITNIFNRDKEIKQQAEENYKNELADLQKEKDKMQLQVDEYQRQIDEVIKKEYPNDPKKAFAERQSMQEKLNEFKQSKLDELEAKKRNADDKFNSVIEQIAKIEQDAIQNYKAALENVDKMLQEGNLNQQYSNTSDTNNINQNVNNTDDNLKPVDKEIKLVKEESFNLSDNSSDRWLKLQIPECNGVVMLPNNDTTVQRLEYENGNVNYVGLLGFGLYSIHISKYDGPATLDKISQSFTEDLQQFDVIDEKSIVYKDTKSNGIRWRYLNMTLQNYDFGDGNVKPHYFVKRVAVKGNLKIKLEYFGILKRGFTEPLVDLFMDSFDFNDVGADKNIVIKAMLEDNENYKQMNSLNDEEEESADDNNQEADNKSLDDNETETSNNLNNSTNNSDVNVDNSKPMNIIPEFKN